MGLICSVFELSETSTLGGPEYNVLLKWFISKLTVRSRIGNPTLDVFEKRIAALEGGVAAVAACVARFTLARLSG